MEFSSERKQHTILEIYEKYQNSMPLVLKVKHGYRGSLLDRPLEKDEILVLAVVSRQYRVVAAQQCTFKHRILSIPASFSETLCEVNEETKEYGHESYLCGLLRKHEIPFYVRLPKKRTITLDHKHFNTDDIPGFHIEKTFEEVNLLGNMILEGTVEEEEILAIPIFLTELKLSIVNGIKGHPKKDWVAFQEKLKAICANVPYDFEYGSNKLAEYSHDMIQYSKDYTLIEPKCVIPLQDLVDIVPTDMLKEMQEASSHREPPPIPDDIPDDEYEEIDLLPDLMPKPIVKLKAPVERQILKPFHRTPPPLPPMQLVDTTSLPQPSSPSKTANAHMLNPDCNSAKITKMHLPVVSGDNKCKDSITKAPPPNSGISHNVKPPILKKPTACYQTNAERPCVSSKSEEHKQNGIKVKTKVSKTTENYAKGEKMESIRNGPEMAPAVIKHTPSANPTTYIDTMHISSNTKQNGTKSLKVNIDASKPCDAYIAMTSPNIAQQDISSGDPCEDGYEYVSLSSSQMKQDAHVTTDQLLLCKGDKMTTNSVDLVVYENNLPTQIVNPVKNFQSETFETPVTETVEKCELLSIQSKEEEKVVKTVQDESKIDIRNLTVQDVCEYLEKLKLEKYSDTFLANMVDGVLLLTLDEDVLVSDFEMKKIEALRLLRFTKEGTLPKLRNQ